MSPTSGDDSSKEPVASEAELDNQRTRRDGSTANENDPTSIGGPHSDPVFRSLPAGETISENESATPSLIGAKALLLARNIYTLVPIEDALSSFDVNSESLNSAREGNSAILAELEEVDREVIRGIAADFVKHHVRRLTTSVAFRSRHESFGKGTLLMSSNIVPTSKLRHASFQWAVTNGHVVELKNVRLPVSHVATCESPSALEVGGPLRGAAAALLIAYVLDAIDVTPAKPIAAIGDIATSTNELLFAQGLDLLLEAAHEDGMHDVILPLHNQKMSGRHGAVCYWPSKDANGAIFAVMRAISGDVVNPILVRRALTKQAYSWGSLIFTLLAIGAYQLAVAFGGQPPVTFLAYVLGLTSMFLVGSVVCTHRYWMLDR